MDVLLKWKVDVGALVVNERALLDLADTLPRHARVQIVRDVLVLEVKEVSRVVPNEADLAHRLAVAADLRVALDDQIVLVLREGRCGKPAHPSAHNQGPYRFHLIILSAQRACSMLRP